MYADDVSVRSSNKNLEKLQTALQTTLTKVYEYGQRWGLDFNGQKSSALIIAPDRVKPPQITLSLGKTRIPNVQEAKLLGVTFDHKLTFESHCRNVAQNASTRVNVLSVLNGAHSGINRTNLRTLYQALVRSKLDYAGSILLNATDTAKNLLYKTQNKGLRIILRAPYSTAISAMEIEASIPPTELRWEKSFVNQITKGIANKDSNITGLFKKRLRRRPGNRQLVRDRYQKLSTFYLPELTKDDSMISNLLPSMPPWIAPGSEEGLTFNIHWLDIPKDNLTAPELKHRFLQEKSLQVRPSLHVFTDGSRCPATRRTAAAYTSTKGTVAFRLQDEISIMTAEQAAIKQALSTFNPSTEPSLNIYSDCISALVDIQSGASPMAKTIRDAASKYQTVQFVWCPSHVGVAENEQVDKAAKAALHSDVIERIPWTPADLRTRSRDGLLLRWQTRWNAATTGRLLHQVKATPSLIPDLPLPVKIRDNVLIRMRCRRLPIQQVKYDLKLDSTNKCDLCQVAETMSHFLLNCPKYAEERKILKSVCDQAKLQFSVSNLLGSRTLPEWQRATITEHSVNFVAKTIGLSRAVKLFQDT